MKLVVEDDDGQGEGRGEEETGEGEGDQLFPDSVVSVSVMELFKLPCPLKDL